MPPNEPHKPPTDNAPRSPVAGIADWQLPPGVRRESWDYLSDRRTASEYDTRQATGPLVEFDQQFIRQAVERWRAENPRCTLRLLDLGCGTGRSVCPLLEGDIRAVGVDLSESMLLAAGDKVAAMSPEAAGKVRWLRANIAQPLPLPDRSFDLIICMFSSLGMVAGSEHRLACLREAHRLLADRGTLIVHVHNRGRWWLSPAGRRQLWRSWQLARSGRGEWGDQVNAYLHLPKMYLHIFSAGELHRLLAQAGYHRRELVPISVEGDRVLSGPRYLNRWRAGGFFAVANRTA